MDNTKLLQDIATSVRKQGYVETPFPSTTVGTADANSSEMLVDISKMVFGNMNMQVIWTGFTSTDATVKLQSSNTGASNSWIDVTDSTITLNAASGTLNVVAAYAASQYVRVVFSKTTNAGGTFEVTISFK